MSSKVKNFIDWISQLNEKSAIFTILNDDMKRDHLYAFEERLEGQEEVLREIAARPREERAIIITNLCRLYPITKKLVKFLLQKIDKSNLEHPIDYYMATGEALLRFLSAEVKDLRADIKGQTSSTFNRMQGEVSRLQVEEENLLAEKQELEQRNKEHDQLIKRREKLLVVIEQLQQDQDPKKIEEDIKDLIEKLRVNKRKGEQTQKEYTKLKKELEAITETSEDEKKYIKSLVQLWPTDAV